MDPQTCTKCNTLPEDILMLACAHDLCLNCAADRLAFEMKKKKPATSIVCEFCYERTPLDTESIHELEKLIPAKSHFRMQREKSKGSTARLENGNEEYKNNMTDNADRYPYEMSSKLGIDRGYEKNNSKSQYTSKMGNEKIFSGISGRKQCSEHPDEEILYFCFDCKCQCICPECIIHGKHKDHDVKTIRKSQPIIKAEVQSSLQKLENSIQGLLIRKSQAEKQVRSLNQQNNISKRQIQQAFQDLRATISTQEKQVLAKCDQVLDQSLEELETINNKIIQRVEEMKSHTVIIQDSMKKEDILFLNFYSQRWKKIQDDIRDNDFPIPSVSLPGNQAILQSTLDAKDYIAKIGSLQRPTQNKNVH